MSLLATLKDAQKEAMRAKDKVRLGTIRMALAAVKQKEVDERVEVTETDVLAILTKMVKQRKESSIFANTRSSGISISSKSTFKLSF